MPRRAAAPPLFNSPKLRPARAGTRTLGLLNRRLGLMHALSTGDGRAARARGARGRAARARGRAAGCLRHRSVTVQQSQTATRAGGHPHFGTVEPKRVAECGHANRARARESTSGGMPQARATPLFNSPKLRPARAATRTLGLLGRSVSPSAGTRTGRERGRARAVGCRWPAQLPCSIVPNCDPRRRPPALWDC